MNGVGLSRYGRQLYTDPGFQIPWNVEDDLLDFNRLGQGFSATTLIPIKGNEWVFGYASDPARSSNRFKTYDGFAITFGGNVWWEVSCDLLRVSDDGHFYEVILSTIDSEVYSKRDTSLRDLLSESYFSYPSGGYTNVYAHYNGTTNRGIRFPHCHFYNEINVNPSTKDKIHIINSDVYAVPFFTLRHLLDKVCEVLGYKARIFTSKPSALDQYLVCTPNQFGILQAGGSLPYGTFVPDITVYDLLYELMIFGGVSIHIDADNKEIVGEEITYTSNRLPVDLKDQLMVKNVSASGLDNIGIRYSTDNDFLLAGPKILTGNYLGEFPGFAQLSLVSDPQEDDYGYCIFEMKYYKFVTFNDELRLEPYSHPFIERITGQQDLILFESKFSPALRDRSYYGEYDVDCSLVESSLIEGRVMLKGFETNIDIINQYDFVGIMEMKEREKVASRIIGFSASRNRSDNANSRSSRRNGYSQGLPTTKVTYSGRSGSGNRVLESDYYTGVLDPKMYFNTASAWYNSISGTPEDSYMELLMDYIDDRAVSKIKLSRQLTKFIPIIGKPLTRHGLYDFIAQDDTGDNTGTIVQWHGMQYNFSKTETYPYASSDNYFETTEDGVDYLSGISLQIGELVEESTIWSQIITPLFNFMKSTRIVGFTGSLSPTQVKKLIRRKKGGYIKGMFRFRAFRALLTREGIRDQEIDGYGL